MKKSQNIKFKVYNTVRYLQTSGAPLRVVENAKKGKKYSVVRLWRYGSRIERKCKTKLTAQSIANKLNEREYRLSEVK